MKEGIQLLDKLIKNGTIITHNGRYKGNIAIKNEKIHGILNVDEVPNALESIDASGKFIIPGVIDGHVHFQDPGLTHREDFPSGTMAAAMGGVTTAISHPMNIPPIVDEDSYKFTINSYKNRGYIDYAIHGGGTSDNLSEIESLWENTGATAIKMFMCFSVADFPYVKDDALYSILKSVAKVDGLALIHAENNELIELEEGRLKSEGRNDPMAYHESHSAIGELEAVKRAIYYLEATGAKGIILHTCMQSSLEEIKKAQLRGVQVYAETCPHYLVFKDTDMVEYGPYLKFSPVMRDEENRKKLWKLLEDGYISIMGSDHSPFQKEEKDKGLMDIWAAPNGIPGIQTLLPVLIDGVNQGLLSLEKLVEVTSYNTSKLYGLDDRKGSIEIGKDADLVIIDLDTVKEYTREDIQSKEKWSPYIGRTFRGYPVMTIVRGETIMKDGKIVGNVGYGKYIERKKG